MPPAQRAYRYNLSFSRMADMWQGKRILKQLIGETTEQVQAHIADLAPESYRGKQIAEWLYRRILPGQGGGAAAQFANMSDLPVALRGQLAERFELAPMTLAHEARDRRDGTIKIVATTTPDALEIESVLMPDDKRVSVCLSTQAGCPMACAFCATGTQGLARNLTVAEIVGQLLILQSLSPRAITHAVFMGMGEPLLNLPNLLQAIRVLHGEVGLSMRHITVSTVGIVPAIEKLAAEEMPINLAISLHAPTDTLRKRIVPHHKSVKELIVAARSYFRRTGREITFEYVLLRGVNDNPEQARELADLLRTFPSCTVNLIPYNATTVAEQFQRPEGARIRLFRQVLEDAHVRVTQRKERGHEIAAACGQLVTQPYKHSVTNVALPMVVSAEAVARVAPTGVAH
jgi:23S rRNA (adenine2503-C2)-methyltransferase